MGTAQSSAFSSSSTAEEVIRGKDLSNQVVIITGCNTGIGKETARVLYAHHAHVIMACRDAQKMQQAMKEIKEQSPHSQGQLEGFLLQLEDANSIKQFVQEFLSKNLPLHILILNAAIMAVPFRTTLQGFESHMGINHFGHFMLTNLLLPTMKQTLLQYQDHESIPILKIIVVSSVGHKLVRLPLDDLHWQKRRYDPGLAYCQSKLANLLFSSHLAKKLQSSTLTRNIHTFAVHPGTVATELGREKSYLFTHLLYKLGSSWMKTTAQGAATTIYCATASECEHDTGLYYADCQLDTPSVSAKNEMLAEQLWTISEQLTQISYPC